MSENNQSEGVSPHGFLLASGCISALIVGSVAVVAALIARSHFTSIGIAAAALLWVAMAFRVGSHWDDKGWTRDTHRGMIDSFIASLFGFATIGAIMHFTQPVTSRIDLVHLGVAILVLAAAELAGFFTGLWMHRRTQGSSPWNRYSQLNR